MLYNFRRLQEEIDAEGIPGDAGYGYVTFRPEATPAQRQRAAEIIASHNPAELSQGQTREAQRVVAQQALKGAAITTMLQNITEDSADIVTDLTAVTGLSVLALVTLKPILLRILARQARIENRLEIILKVLSHE